MNNRNVWEKWFAWHPIFLEWNKIAWLKYVERDLAMTPTDGSYWMYREPKTATNAKSQPNIDTE